MVTLLGPLPALPGIAAEVALAGSEEAVLVEVLLVVEVERSWAALVLAVVGQLGSVRATFVVAVAFGAVGYLALVGQLAFAASLRAHSSALAAGGTALAVFDHRPSRLACGVRSATSRPILRRLSTLDTLTRRRWPWQLLATGTRHTAVAYRPHCSPFGASSVGEPSVAVVDGARNWVVAVFA